MDESNLRVADVRYQLSQSMWWGCVCVCVCVCVVCVCVCVKKDLALQWIVSKARSSQALRQALTYNRTIAYPQEVVLGGSVSWNHVVDLGVHPHHFNS